MTIDSQSENPFNRDYYLSVFLRFILFMVGGFFAGQIASSFVYMYYFGEDLSVMSQIIQDPENNLSLGKPLLLLQAANSLMCFLVFPLLFVAKTQFPIHYNSWNNNPQVAVSSFSNMFVIMFFVLPLSSVLVEWNQMVVLPDFLSGFEIWARESEKHIEAMTRVITHFSSLPDFLVGILIIGVLAAVGEELTFRGVLQPLFIHLFRNKHVGVLITAFIFGAIHMQFFSFLPRFALGVLFGYIYVYSQNLWVPIFGHFVNNSLSLLFVYRYGMDKADVPVDALDQSPWVLFVFSSAVVVGVFFFLKRLWANNSGT